MQKISRPTVLLGLLLLVVAGICCVLPPPPAPPPLARTMMPQRSAILMPPAIVEDEPKSSLAMAPQERAISGPRFVFKAGHPTMFWRMATTTVFGDENASSYVGVTANGANGVADSCVAVDLGRRQKIIDIVVDCLTYAVNAGPSGFGTGSIRLYVSDDGEHWLPQGKDLETPTRKPEEEAPGKVTFRGSYTARYVLFHLQPSSLTPTDTLTSRVYGVSFTRTEKEEPLPRARPTLAAVKRPFLLPLD